MSNFHTLRSSFSPDNQIRGKQFEAVCKWFLETDPHYANRLKKVWLWEDWPSRWGADCGIDLIAKDSDGKLWAIQAKCYDPSYSVTKHDLDKFLSESTNEKIDYRLLIATTDQIGGNARRVIERQNQVLPFNMVLLDDLEQAPLVWPSSIDELGTGHAAEKATPRAHQVEAIEAATTKLIDRGQMIMACGTGKTLTGLWLAEKLESKRTLVLLPSLLLLSKTLADWVAHANEPFAYLPVCSDETVARNVDSVVSSTAELAFPSTTDTDEIRSFLRKRGTRVVFSTYQSSPKIAEAFKQGNVPGFDLVIADEAHRCAGKVASEYGTVLDNDAIPAKKRLFMTATPRVYTPHLRKAAENSGFDVASMDDEAVFGPVLHRLTFGQAIELDLLSDYQVVVVGIDDPAYHLMVDERRIVETDSGITSDARSLASHVGLAKAMRRYNLRRVITFHSRVKWASQFATELTEVVNWMPKRYRPDGEIKCSYVSGDMSTSLRNQRLASLADLESGQRAVLANARCLSEGVDVPALDGVAFIDPRKSEIDIVQAVGRAIRLSPDKLKGTIIIPVFISDGDDPDTVLSGSEFDKVWKVVNALRAHDDALGEELDSLRTQLGKRGSTERPSKIVLDVPTKIGIQFASAFDTRLIEATTASWQFNFGLLENYIDRKGTSRVPQSYKTPDGYNLGVWITHQRTQRAKSTLSKERIKQLESLPDWVWDPISADWEIGFQYLEHYMNRKGHTRVSKSYVNAYGYNLGNWVAAQRRIRSRLSQSRIQRLEALAHWTWNARESRWEEAFEYLCAYVDIEKHALVPSDYITKDNFTLGRWIVQQRSSREKLSNEQIGRLEALPKWTWHTIEAKWEEGFGCLERYVRKEKHALVPQSYITLNGYALGAWVANQRQNQKAGKLSNKQVNKLNCLPNWQWDKRDGLWDTNLKLLEKYIETEGHSLVPRKYRTKDGVSLGAWVASQRSQRAKLSHDRRSRLEALTAWEWYWDVHSARWEEGFSHLERYVHAENTALVPYSYITSCNYPLGQWVSIQRQKKSGLSQENVSRLEYLPNWKWNPIGARWEEGFDYLKAFIKQEHHSLVPYSYETTDGYKLGAWVSNQRMRKVKLSQEQRDSLQSLPGWSWNARDATWQEGFMQLAAYVEREGHAQIPAAFCTSDGFGLGSWVNTQRTNRNKMSQVRKIQLQSINGWEWNARDAAWEIGFFYLSAFVILEKHAKVPKAYKTDDGYGLGTWVANQRRRKAALSADRIKRLEALPDWSWNTKST